MGLMSVLYVPGTFSGSKGIAEMEAPVRMPAGESLGSMEGLVLRLASDGRAYSFYLRTGGCDGLPMPRRTCGVAGLSLSAEL